MGSSRVRLYGGTSGFVELAAPDVADDGALVLPTAAEGILKASGGIGSNVVVGTMTSSFATTSATDVDVTGWEVTITPSSAAARVLVLANTPRIIYADNASGVETTLVASSGATNIPIAIAFASSGGSGQYPASGAVLHLPSSVLPVTYQMRVRRLTGTGTVTVDQPARLIAIEVAA